MANQPSNPLCEECQRGGETTCDHLDQTIDEINKAGGTPGQKLDKAINAVTGRRDGNGSRRR